MNKNILKLFPFIISLIIGLAMYYFASNCLSPNLNNLQSLLINLSATLIGITITYFSYNLIKDFTEQNLNKTLFYYSKSRIDNEILSVLMQVQKMLYSFDKLDRSFDGISAMLGISKEELKKQILSVELLGYQIFKNWDFSLSNIEKIIENSYTLKYLTNEQIISLVNILSAVEKLNTMYMFGKDNIFIDTGKISNEHTIVPPHQSNLPNRSILLKKIEGKPNEGVVVDSGDIPIGELKKALNIYKVKDIEEYVDRIGVLLETINHWMKLTGNTLFISIRDKRWYNPQTKKFVY